MKPFSVIVAVDQNRGIGKAGQLPWHLPEDLKYFKRLTCQASVPDKMNAVIMGRKTWESIPDAFRPLKDRLNIVLTRDFHFELPSEVVSASDLPQAFDVLDSAVYQNKIEKIFIIGGAEVFKQAIKLPQCEKLYITEIQQIFDCDVFFPFYQDQFERLSFSSCHNQNDITFFFAEYRRKR